MAIVIRDKESIFKELLTVNDLPIQIKLLPYRSSSVEDDTVIEGCIVALTDLNPGFMDNTYKATGAPFSLETLNKSNFDGEKISVLVLDDSESDRNVIKRHLSKIESMQVSVVEAENISEGLASIDDVDVDICLVDYRLGVETAAEFIDKVKFKRRKMPVVMLSGFDREQLEKELSGMVIDHFVNKENMSPLLLEIAIKHAMGTADEKSKTTQEEPA